MDRPPAPTLEPTLADQFAAALDWWRDAGVDAVFVDDAQSLLAAVTVTEAKVALPPKARAEAPAPPPQPLIGGDRAGWPADLADFADWWLTEPTLAPGPLAARIAPRLVAKADLLILVPMPERDAQDVVSGAHAVLVANMMRAMGLTPDAVAIAAALPANMPAADWDGLRQQGLGAVLLHLIGLVGPRRVLVLGQDVLTLLGMEKRQGVRELPLAESQVPLLASLAPDILLGNARSRADLWRRWLDWTGPA